MPAADRCCPCCGTAYVPNGYKASWLYEIDWNVIMRKILRLRYKPACGCAAARPVIAKPAPRLGSSQLGPSVWAWCLVQVYWLFRPQAAVARDLEALGLRIPASTLSQGLRRLSHLFEPLEAAIRQRQREAAVAQADETSWPVQFIHGADASCDPPERGRQKPKSWLWVCLAADTALMRILPSRSASSAAQLLEHLGRKAVMYLMCDRYSAYKAFIQQHPELQVVPVYCWVHMRRDWVRAGAGHAELKAWSEEWVERLGKVFHLNRRRQEVWQEGLELEAQSAEFRACQQQLEEAVEELFRRALEEGQALQEAWERLSRELGPDGARAAGLLFGVFETLRRAGAARQRSLAAVAHERAAPGAVAPGADRLAGARRGAARGGGERDAGGGGLNAPARRARSGPGPAHRAAPLHDVLRPAPDAAADRRHPGDRRPVAAAEPHRAGPYHLRAPGLADPARHQSHPAGHARARGTGAARDPDPAG